MLDFPRFQTVAEAVRSRRPILCVVIDTEEEFDWRAPFRREARSVKSIAAQYRAHDVFATYDVVPTYVIDHPVVSDPDAVATLKSYRDSGHCEIGTHLHPWVNPPYEESVNQYNSYACNLPPSLEREKLRILTDAIEAAFAFRPRIYKAGRFGLGTNTPAILAELGYKVDTSMVAYTRFTDDGGPDFSHVGPHHCALTGAPEILELPVTVGYVGQLRRFGPRYGPLAFGPNGMRFHVPGVLARSRMLERIRLTPEGLRAADHRRLIKSLLRDGLRVFNYTYHSPSLEPGYTPYVRTNSDLTLFLDDMTRFFEYFFGELGGIAATPLELYQLWQKGHLDGQSEGQGSSSHLMA